MTTVTVQAVFGRQRDSNPAPRSPTLASPEAGAVSRTARLLALGYKVRRLLDAGVLPDQREAATRLDIVFPQLTHILNLTYLAPRIQERILLGELVLSEGSLRPTCRITSWDQQIAELNGRLAH